MVHKDSTNCSLTGLVQYDSTVFSTLKKKSIACTVKFLLKTLHSTIAAHHQL